MAQLVDTLSLILGAVLKLFAGGVLLIAGTAVAVLTVIVLCGIISGVVDVAKKRKGG